MNTQEVRKSDAIRFINTIAKANKMLDKDYESLKEISVYPLTAKNLGMDRTPECHMYNVTVLADLVGIPILEERLTRKGLDFPIMKYFDYKGTRFFSVYKEEEV